MAGSDPISAQHVLVDAPGSERYDSEPDALTEVIARHELERGRASRGLGSSAPPSGAPSREHGQERSPESIQAEDDERARLIAALDACAGNQTRAAQMLGITRRQLIGRIEHWQLPRPKKR
jgi:transcriptional regulator with GAF, ATPase, and Fis domain